MRNVLGMIYTGENDSRLRELTLTRAIAALPVAGRYRIVDFHVSSLVNSGIRNVGVVMQKNYHSLMDHLGTGKEWDLHSKANGLFLLPPFLTRENVGVYAGLIDAIRSNTNYLNRSKQEYVLLCGSSYVYNADFSQMIKEHMQVDADVTLLYSKDPTLKRRELGTYISIDENNTIIDMEVEPIEPSFNNTSLDVCLIKKELLLQLVDQATSHGYHDFNRDILQRLTQSNQIKACAVEFKEKAWLIDSVESYYQFNLDLLQTPYRRYLFSTSQPILTKVRDEMPAQYSLSSKVSNSLVADGAYVQGNVEDSVLFRGVTVEPNAHIKNCIIMQDAHIESGAYIENCILDKQAVIKQNTRLIGPPTYPIVISKKVVI